MNKKPETTYELIDKLERDKARLEEQRTELLDALKAVVECFRNGTSVNFGSDAVTDALGAIAKAEK